MQHTYILQFTTLSIQSNLHKSTILQAYVLLCILYYKNINCVYVCIISHIIEEAPKIVIFILFKTVQHTELKVLGVIRENTNVIIQDIRTFCLELWSFLSVAKFDDFLSVTT